MNKGVLTEEERFNLAAACYADPVLFCRTFLEHWFPSDIPWVHRGILAILCRKTDFLLRYGEIDKIESNFVYALDPTRKDSPLGKIFIVERNSEGTPVKIDLVVKRYTLLQMPRGFAKTTLANAANLYDIEYHDCKFPLYVSETGNHARMQLGNVKRELETNAMLNLVFGNKVPGRQDAEKWTEDQIMTLDGISLVARGRGGQVRGLNINAQRPDKVLIDDLEDKESVSTAEQLTKTRTWFFSDLKPVLPKLDPNARLIMLGTLLHADALLQTLQKDPEFTSIVFGALDRQGEPLWRENMDEEKLEKEKASYALAGNLSEFYMEYMSKLSDEKTAKFRREFFHYTPNPEVVAKAIAIDPAIANSATADSTTLAVVGIGAKGIITVLDVVGQKGMSPREQIDTYFDLITKWDPDRFGVEAIAYQRALIHFMQEEMFRRKRYFEIVPLKYNTSKTERILGILQPRYASGYIHHARIFPELEAQLLDFGQGHDDYPDVVSQAVSLLDPYAAQAATDDLAADTMEPLEDLDDWGRGEPYNGAAP